MLSLKILMESRLVEFWLILVIFISAKIQFDQEFSPNRKG
mgnify:CR=1